MKQACAAIVASALMTLAVLGASYAQNAKADATLIQNVNIFDGKNEKIDPQRAHGRILVTSEALARVTRSA
jgi:hypothetical protein